MKVLSRSSLVITVLRELREPLDLNECAEPRVPGRDRPPPADPRERWSERATHADHSEQQDGELEAAFIDMYKEV